MVFNLTVVKQKATHACKWKKPETVLLTAAVDKPSNTYLSSVKATIIPSLRMGCWDSPAFGRKARLTCGKKQGNLEVYSKAVPLPPCRRQGGAEV
jgi:hypothetical protein